MNKDFIVGGLAVAPWVIGLLLEEDPLKVIPVADKAKAKEAGKTIQQFGEGGIFYSAPMLVRTTAVMNTPAAPVEARSRSTPPTGQPPARSRGRVIKL